MSNPITNRWGLNLFWYRWWYNDKISALFYHQDALIERIVCTYVNYGTTHTKDTFISKYWLPLSLIKTNDFTNTYMSKVTRYIEHVSKTFGEKNVRKARLKPSAFYHSKVWILRFQNWLVINFYFFQPLKKIRSSKNKRLKSSSSILNYKVFNSQKLILRQKLIFFYLLKTTPLHDYYTFE